MAIKLDGTRGLIVNGGSPNLSVVRGLMGKPNATTPLAKYDLHVDAVVLRDAEGGNVVFYNPADLTCDLSLAGSVANGRDQAAVFPAQNHIYLYYISNGTTLATLASLTPPNTFNGSTLPAGYTYWTFACTVRWGNAGTLLSSWVRGNKVLYDISNAGVQRILNAGVASTMGGTGSTVSASNLVPPIALRATLNCIISAGIGAGGGYSVMVRPTGSVITGIYTTTAHSGSGTQLSASSQFEMALGTNQSLDYYNTSAPTSGGTYFEVVGYVIPNGDV